MTRMPMNPDEAAAARDGVLPQWRLFAKAVRRAHLDGLRYVPRYYPESTDACNGPFIASDLRAHAAKGAAVAAHLTYLASRIEFFADDLVQALMDRPPVSGAAWPSRGRSPEGLER